jgi:hypothetical protein
MSTTGTTGIFDILKAALPTPWNTQTYLGARYLPKHLEGKRLVIYPDRTQYGARQRGIVKDVPRHLCQSTLTLIFDVQAPTVEDIDGETGIVNIIATKLYAALGDGSFAFGTGEWAKDASQVERGEHYIFTINFLIPVVAVSLPETTITLESTSQTVGIEDE